MPTCISNYFCFPCASNRLLQDKKVGVVWQRPFDILTKHKALAGAVGMDNKKGLTSKKPISPVWWGFLHEVKIFFQNEQSKVIPASGNR